MWHPWYYASEMVSASSPNVNHPGHVWTLPLFTEHIMKANHDFFTMSGSIPQYGSPLRHVWPVLTFTSDLQNLHLFPTITSSILVQNILPCSSTSLRLFLKIFQICFDMSEEGSTSLLRWKCVLRLLSSIISNLSPAENYSRSDVLLSAELQSCLNF
jgi:hypothetical protein